MNQKREDVGHERYSWSQTDDRVFFEFMVPDKVTDEEISVSIDTQKLWAGVPGCPDIIKGKLYATIDKQVSSWEVNEHKSGKLVRISLVKHVTGSQWPVPITGGLRLKEDADPKSTFLLGQLTEGVLPKKTLELYLKSAKAGHLSAQLKLGHIYDVGQSSMVEGPNKKEALHWYMQAAAQGCLSAVFYSANFYYRGENKDHSKGLPLYFEAISISQTAPLPPPDIVKWFDGSGVPEFLTPVSVTDRNRLMIFVTSCYLAGKILYRGSNHGIKAQPQKSRELWLQAAEYNHAASLYSLGFLYMEGEGVAIDTVEASRYFFLAWRIDPSFVIPEGIPSYPDLSDDSAYTSVSTTPIHLSHLSPTISTNGHQLEPTSPVMDDKASLNHFTEPVVTILPLSSLSPNVTNETTKEHQPDVTPRSLPNNNSPKDPGSFDVSDWVPIGVALVSGAALASFFFMRQRT
ncbi:hypothetical protein DSO57_1030001 [Entomophthora muscae]|uniref:Uncharacterized protein n=1 Tax=Entomophthora muscae TaxID=34485 RepID=A0ACC2RRZ9_9FUNG|nr:hypothetical protein DSO57_1030001 [Entomophthora muscae]